MTNMKRDIVTSAIGVLVLTLMLGVLYPLVVTGISQVAFPGNANGQRIDESGKLVGSKIIGQQFAIQVVKNGKPVVDKDGNPVTQPDPRYFQSRPSPTLPPYNAGASTFSNLGPNDVATRDSIEGYMKAYLALEKPYDRSLTASKIPVDAVNTTGSGVDPDISVANADIQAHRIASVRHLQMPEVMKLISNNTTGRGLGFSGDPGVNVLELNLALDKLTGGNR
jgi:potassium-transporting ATPase KdpC subunit